MAYHVLIVDDDFVNRKLLHTLLKKHPGVSEVIEAENGSEALNQLKKHNNINMVLLDVIMPILDGVEFLKIFRADRNYADIPVIVLSTDDTKKGEVFDNGANDFIRKPITEEDLFHKMEQWSS